MSAVKTGGIHTIDITGMTHEGQGVGRIDGFTVFVDGALPGETVETRITELKKSYAVGRITGIVTASPDRIVPFCTVYDRCGGCNLQHLDYKAQLKFKTDVVGESIRRIGKLENVVVHETIGMQDTMNYRNKVQYPVASVSGRIMMGFYSNKTHRVIDSEVCGIQHRGGDSVRSILKDFFIKKRIEAYDEKTGKGLVRHVMVRAGHKTGELMVVIVINGTDIPCRRELVDTLISQLPSVSSIMLNINTEKTNIILGEKNVKIFGKDTITDYIGKYRFEISPLSFFQVNPKQTEILYEKVLEYAGLTGSETVFDLYCGTGTIAIFLSQSAGRVYGVEVTGEAVRNAERNAALNGAGNVEFIEGEVEKVLPGLCKSGIKADVVVIDPPRKGCDAVLLETLRDMQPERMVYVSCNPSTLARDLNYLSQNGYTAAEVQPVDMFPWTAHTESVVEICRNKRK